MGCCCACSDDKPDKGSYDPSHSGPTKERHCTDVFCLLLLAVFLAGWSFIAVYAFLYGNLAQLVYPSNSAGQIILYFNNSAGQIFFLSLFAKILGTFFACHQTVFIFELRDCTHEDVILFCVFPLREFKMQF